MNVAATCTLLIVLCSALPAFSQSNDSSTTAAVATSPAGDSETATPQDLSAFREEIARKNKALGDKVANEKAIVKKNAIIIQDAKKIDAANKRLESERKMLDAQNAVFEKERRAMMPDATDSSPQPATSHPTSAPVQNNASPAVHMETAAAATPIAATSGAGSPTSASTVMVNYSASRPAAVAAAPAATSMATATVTASPTGPTRLSEGASMGLLLTPIKPVYPQIAQSTHTEGAVVLDAVISKSGTIESLHPVSGPEILRRAAMDAVQVARYQPYRINGEATPVETTITVVFRMRS